MSVRMRYATIDFPAYRFRPGRTPHPRTHPEGHSHGRDEWRVAPLSRSTWPADQAWRHAIDLFNHGYWWEAHEVLEAFWNAAGRTTAEAAVIQGVIQVAAGCLKRDTGQETGARRLFAAGLEKLARAPDRWCGLEVRDLARQTEAYAGGIRAEPPVAVLRLP